MAKQTILIVDDAQDLRAVLRLYLENAGYEVLEAEDGEAALMVLEDATIDIMILDIMMPRMDGLELIRHLGPNRSFPIIFLSARTQVSDRILGLTLGGDDYITKPFDPSEVVTRVMVVLRRIDNSQDNTEVIIRIGDLEWNQSQRQIRLKDEPLELRAKEYQLLTLFMNHPGRVYTKQEIYEYLWEEPYYHDDNTIMVHISNLRDKIEDESRNPQKLITIRGLGYMLKKVED